jgi:hypothetical protein
MGPARIRAALPLRTITIMRIAVTGSSGTIGSALTTALEARGDDVVRVVRREAGAGEVSWDPASGEIDAAGFEGLDAVVHLAAAGIGDQRWTEDYKRTILNSRVDGTSLLARTLAGLATPPAVFVSQSAAGIYGDRGDDLLTEESGRGDGFLADVVVAWEAAAQPAIDAGIRTVLPRSGQVFSPVHDLSPLAALNAPGTLQRLVPLFRLGLGGKLGSGTQWWSWLSLPDQVRATLFAIDTAGLDGPVNFTSPEPVRNETFTEVLAKVLGKPAFLPVPAFGPKLVVGSELAETLVFDSQRVIPPKLQAAGYEFLHPDLESALRAVLDRPA